MSTTQKKYEDVVKQRDDIMQEYMNRKPFEYDVSGDALYEQYKDRATKNAKLAMEDAIGQATALTGGYGNSYAQSVGQQAFNQQMDSVNAIIPELRQLAYEKYNQEGNDLLNKYSFANDYLSSYVGEDVGEEEEPKTYELPADLIEQAKKFNNNEELAQWAYDLEDSGAIPAGEAMKIISTYFDHNEKTVDVTDDSGNKTTKADYATMIKDPKGWKVVDNGNGNLFGIDANAIVEAPNGKVMKLSQLKDQLIADGMDSSEATRAIKNLQNLLDISSNWVFGW